MKLYQIKTQQKLPISIEKAWDIFSNPKNLKKITPEEMSFEIIGGAEKSIYPGQIIQYNVSPIFGIKLRCTEITHVIDNKYFVDEQRFNHLFGTINIFLKK